jgi:cytochrome d ubiquinol oxidase subunit I
VNAVDVARLQFALLAALHFLFVLTTLGLGPVVAVLGTRWAAGGREVFERATRFWGQLYLVNYALGIVAGLVLELQFGLHFPGLLDVAGEVFGAPLAIETLGAFFLESTLLGLWVFGWHLLPRAVHAALFWGVVVTGYASAFVVMVANGFLRNPVGYAMRGGVAHVTDAAALVTNPAALLSALHVLGACLTAGGFLLVGISAWHLRRFAPGRVATGVDDDLWRRSLRSGVVVGSLGIWLAIGFGFSQFSYLDSPAVQRSSPAVGTALALMMVAGFAIWVGSMALDLLMVRGALFRLPVRVRNGLLWVCVALLPLPYVVGLTGWLARELGRQPWVVQGVLRTDQVGTDQPVGAVVTSLVVLVGVMACLAVLDARVLAGLARRGTGRLVLGATPAQVLRADEDDDGALLRFGTDAPVGGAR